MNLRVPADSVYQTAFYFKKKYNISTSRLQTAALKGFIRTKTLEMVWMPCLYHVADTLKYSNGGRLANMNRPRAREMEMAGK